MRTTLAPKVINKLLNDTCLGFLPQVPAAEFHSPSQRKRRQFRLVRRQNGRSKSLCRHLNEYKAEVQREANRSLVLKLLSEENRAFSCLRSLLKRCLWCKLSLIHICRCRRYAVCRSRWSPYH
eukprot:TRINITY_DN15794_c0_g2_i1.p1 TRINITY_DN15794_c0_g2~~TRINITY_DN15794_c0_g2_i1.p1  ORF type:complete len:123 (-),score=12.82 TRINITY_DN15794_c0_g2_i1:15-383(-)